MVFTYSANPTSKDVTIEQFESAYPAIPSTASTARFGNRYWNITQSATGTNYTVGLNNGGTTPTGTASILRREGSGSTTSNAVSFSSPTYTNSSSFSTTNTSNDVALVETAIPVTISGVVASNKTYTGTIAATLDASSATLNGVVSPDAVTINAASAVGTFACANVANGISVTTSGFALSGANAGAYTISAQPSTTANITAATLSITASDVNKTYGTGLTGGAGSTAFASTGLQNSETIGTVTIAYGTGAAASATAGTYSNSVTPSAATGGTFNASNYSITYNTGSIIVSAGAAGSWVGVTSTDYSTAANWANNAVPTSGTNITVPTGTTYLPALSTNATIGNLSLASGTTIDVSGYTLTLGGTVTGSGLIIGSGNIISTGSFTTLSNANTYTGTTTVSSGVLQLNRTGGTTIPSTNSVIVSGGTLQISSNQSLAGFTISSGGLVIDNGVTTTFSGTYSGSGGTINSLGTIAFTGASKTFPGIGVTLNNGLSNSIANLSIALSSSSNAITISTSANTVNVAGILGLTQGLINTTTLNYLSVTGAVSGGSATSYVSGPLGIYAPNTSTLTFPIGKGGNYRPVTFAYTTSNASNGVIIEQIEGSLTGLPSTISTARFGARYYTVTQYQSGYAYKIGLYNNGITPSGTAVLVRADGATVTTPAYTLASNYYTTSSGYTASNLTNVVGLGETLIPLTVTGATTANKTYDGTTTASVTGGSLVGVVSPDVVTLSQSGTFASKNVGTTIAITGTCSIGGANSSAYILAAQPTLTARNITAAALSVTANNVTKAYGATLTSGSGSTAFASSGLLGSETIGTVTITYGTGAAAGAASGTYTGSVTPSAATGGTFSASNYTITYNSGNITVSCAPGTWIGGTSTAWANSANWCSGTIPTSATSVVIPAGVTNLPAIVGTSPVNDLTIASGASLTITGTLQVAGTISNSGTLDITGGTIEMNGSSAQTIAASTFASNTVQNLIVNNNAGVTLGGTLNVTGTVTPTLGTLNTGGNLVLKSSATGTARVAQGTGSYLNGNVTVERYITPKTVRKFSMVAATTSQSIRNAWQNQIYITGAGTGGAICGSTTGNGVAGTDKYNSNGFDKTQSNSASMYTYNLAQVNNSRWVSVPNTSDNLVPGKGYRINIRGDRNSATVSCADQLNSTTPTAPEAVTLSANGTVSTGNVVVAINDPAVHAFSLLGNPYPSQISFTAFQASNSNINNNVWTYSPFGNGNYTTYSSGLIANGATGYDNTNGDIIASGQAFFVEANASGSVTFAESHKTATTLPNTQYFGTSNSKLIRVGLKTTANASLDEDVIRFNSFGSHNYVPSWDATSLNTASQVLVALKGSTRLAIATFPDTMQVVTVKLGVSSTTNGTFRLAFSDYAGLDSNSTITLRDQFLGTNIDVRSNTIYDFNITADSLSKGNNRFELVFAKPGALPVNFTSISATQANHSISVKCHLANETNLKGYTVERSTTGKQFTVIATTNATGYNSYTIEDKSLPDGVTTLYYRIKSIEQNGASKYSPIAKVMIADAPVAETKLSIFPNPVQDKLNLTLTNAISNGSYTVRIINLAGKQVMMKTGIVAANNIISLKANELASGVYMVELTNANGYKWQEKFVKE